MNGNIHSIILIIIFILEIILGLYFIFKKQRSHISISYGLLTFGVAFWVLGIGLLIGLSNLDQAFFWTKIAYISAALLATSFLYFSWVFPYRVEINKSQLFLVFSPLIFIIYLAFFTDILINKIVVQDWGREIIYGNALHIYSIWFLIFWIWATVNLIKKYMKSDGIHRWQLKYVLLGIWISAVFGITFNLIFPWFGNLKYNWVGTESSIIWLGFTSYII